MLSYIEKNLDFEKNQRTFELSTIFSYESSSHKVSLIVQPFNNKVL